MLSQTCIIVMTLLNIVENMRNISEGIQGISSGNTKTNGSKSAGRLNDIYWARTSGALKKTESKISQSSNAMYLDISLGICYIRNQGLLDTSEQAFRCRIPQLGPF